MADVDDPSLSYSAQQINELLRCPVCWDRFRSPKLLPCQHTFCQSPCLEQLVDRFVFNPLPHTANHQQMTSKTSREIMEKIFKRKFYYWIQFKTLWAISSFKSFLLLRCKNTLTCMKGLKCHLEFILFHAFTTSGGRSLEKGN